MKDFIDLNTHCFYRSGVGREDDTQYLLVLNLYMHTFNSNIIIVIPESHLVFQQV